MDSIIKLLLDAADSGDKEEKETLYEMVRGDEEYFTDLLCGLIFLSPEERNIIEKNYPKFFSQEKVKTI